MINPQYRVLSLEELRRLWLALDQATSVSKFDENISSMSLITASAIKLLILTGARRGEVAAMRWTELELDDGIWILPKERTKNRQAHTIYLSDLAIETIHLLQTLIGHSTFVFDTGHYKNSGHIHPDTLTGVVARLRGATKGVKKKIITDAPLADMRSFSIHDLRRSAATAWGEYLKIEPHVIERMLNHQPLNKLVATYQRAIYADEQKQAWLSWGKMVEQYVTKNPDNVIPIRYQMEA